MPAFNIVRFRVKPGQVESFIQAHRRMEPAFEGFGGGWLVRTGDDTFCMIGQWETFEHIVSARPEMIKMLDETRAMLEDLGSGLGITDPVSGSAVVTLGRPTPMKKRATKGPKTKPAKKRGARTTPKVKPAGKRPATPRKAKPAKKRSAAARKAKPAKKRAASARKR